MWVYFRALFFLFLALVQFSIFFKEGGYDEVPGLIVLLCAIVIRDWAVTRALRCRRSHIDRLVWCFGERVAEFIIISGIVTQQPRYAAFLIYITIGAATLAHRLHLLAVAE
jgi:hypothetical protein